MADSLSALGDTVPERKQSLFDLLGTAATRRMDYLSALKGMAGSLMTLPQRALGAAGELQRTGDQYNPEPAVETALTMAGARIPTVKPGELGIFGGRLAATADNAALAKAEEMAAKGAPREQIWNETGWFQGAEGKWRFEIPDNNHVVDKSVLGPISRFERANQYIKEQGYVGDVGSPKVPEGVRKEALHFADQTANSRGTVPLDKYLVHDELYAAYPGTEATPLGHEGNATLRGSYDPRTNIVRSVGGTLREMMGAKDSTLLHELQHQAQQREGFELGANTADFTYGNSPLFKHRKSYETPSDAYRRVAGEVEARNVQSRMDMTPEQRRAQPPWTTEDVPTAQQIVR